jgi:hypothetical protein
VDEGDEQECVRWEWTWGESEKRKCEKRRRGARKKNSSTETQMLRERRDEARRAGPSKRSVQKEDIKLIEMKNRMCPHLWVFSSFVSASQC